MLSYQSSSLLLESQYLPVPDQHLKMHIGEAGDLGAMEPSIHKKDARLFIKASRPAVARTTTCSKPSHSRDAVTAFH
jgi:hypothetical protein